MKRVLSKSQVNTFIQCPLKWKFIYVDGEKSEPNDAQKRGINIHKKIEQFYSKPEADLDLKNFVNFETRRIKGLIDDNKFELRYFYPLFQELKMYNDEIGLKGIVDAVYINPKDDKLIIIDWKTGKYYGNKLDDYRFELAVYAELIKHCKKLNVGYWGIYFTDQDKLFFEEIDDEYIRRMYSTIERTREQMKSGEYPRNRTFWCKYCQFKDRCV